MSCCNSEDLLTADLAAPYTVGVLPINSEVFHNSVASLCALLEVDVRQLAFAPPLHPFLTCTQ